MRLLWHTCPKLFGKIINKLFKFIKIQLQDNWYQLFELITSFFLVNI